MQYDWIEGNYWALAEVCALLRAIVIGLLVSVLFFYISALGLKVTFLSVQSSIPPHNTCYIKQFERWRIRLLCLNLSNSLSTCTGLLFCDNLHHTSICRAESEALVVLPTELVRDSCLSVCPPVWTHITAPVKNFWWSWNSDIFQSYNQSQYDGEITTFPQEQSVSSSADQLIRRTHK